MLFSKITLFSLIALATALPNAIPEPEPEANALEARTFIHKWWNNKCECDCKESNYRRDLSELETRTIWLLPSKGDYYCKKECKEKCDKYYEEQEKKCKEKAKYDYEHCKNQCKNKRTNNNDNCKDKCYDTYKHAKKYCEDKYDH